MAFEMDMQTYDARVSSFETAHNVGKRRTSSSRSHKTVVTWPHESPTPHELARAGFFYQPTTTHPDNVVCFICGKSIDGWEEDDIPVIEHLKHSPNCCWAINLSIEVIAADPENVIEDPYSERMIEARQQTFGTRWPHDGKRGWTCKSEKMAEAGWYYAPAADSIDYVSCPYCNLCLDGWEPKDSPLEEHKRRSPNCVFFTFTPPNSKPRRKRGGRASKASRTSTQSTRESSIQPDFEDSIVSISSTMTTGTARKTSRKKTGKTSKSRSKKQEAVEPSIIEEDDIFSEEAIDTQPKPHPSMRGRKRKSEASVDEPVDERPSKRQSTRRSRNSATASNDVVYLNDEDASMSDFSNMEPLILPKTRTKTGKKRASSSSRNSSARSLASEASLRTVVPNDAEIDAALEADLEKPLSDEEQQPEPEPELDDEEAEEQEPEPPKKAAKGRKTSKKTSASVAKTRKAASRKVSRKKVTASTEQSESNSVVYPSPEPDTEDAANQESDMPMSVVDTDERSSILLDEDPLHISDVTVDISTIRTEYSVVINNAIQDDSGHETDTSTATKRKSSGTRDKKAKRSSVKAKNDGDDNQTEVYVKSENEADTNGEPSVVSKRHSRGSRSSTRTHSTTGMVEQLVGVQIPDAREALEPKDSPEAPKKIEMPVKESTEMTSVDLEEPEESPAEVENAFEPSERQASPPTLSEKMPGSFSESPEIPAENMVEESIVYEPIAEMKEVEEPRFNSAILDGSSAKQLASADALNEHTSGEKETEPTEEESLERTQLRESVAMHWSSTASSPQSSDAENQPPSSRPSQVRPPLASPTRQPSQTVHFLQSITTPTPSPSRNADVTGNLRSSHPWRPIDLETVLLAPSSSTTPTTFDLEDKGNQIFSFSQLTQELQEGKLTNTETKMTVEEWILWNADKAEEKLRRECERMVGVFESEGGRAMRALEGIECEE